MIRILLNFLRVPYEDIRYCKFDILYSEDSTKPSFQFPMDELPVLLIGNKKYSKSIQIMKTLG